MNAGRVQAAGACVGGEVLGAHALVGHHGGCDGATGHMPCGTPMDVALPNDLRAALGLGRGELPAGEGSSASAKALAGRGRRALAQHLVDVHERDHGHAGRGQVACDHAQERLPLGPAAHDLREADGRDDQVEASAEVERGGIARDGRHR